MKKKIVALIVLAFSTTTYPWTFVYYLIHRRQDDLTKAKPFNDRAISSFSIIPEVTGITRHITDEPNLIDVQEESFLGGAIFDFKYVGVQPWWFGIRTALIQENSKVTGSNNFTLSRFGFDDIYIQGGYNFVLTDDWQLAMHGGVGLPTSLKPDENELFNTLGGSRLFSMGLGGELSYAVINKKDQVLSLNFHTRLLHFFTRSFTPILQCGEKLQPGNATDIFPSISYTHGDHYLEIDYDLIIFTNVAVLSNPNRYLPVMYQHAPYIQYYYTINWPRTHVTTTVGMGLQYSYARLFDRKQWQAWWLIGTKF